MSSLARHASRPPPPQGRTRVDVARPACSAQGAELSIGLVFCALGSTLFCYLLLKSRYIPRVLAWWGLLGSAISLLSSLTIIVFPAASGIAPNCYIPVGIFEIVTGFWLLFRGIRLPRIPEEPTVSSQPR